MEQRDWEHPNWIEYNIYLLPFRKLVCLLRGHSWFYNRRDVEGEEYSKVCKRCGRAEVSFTVG